MSSTTIPSFALYELAYILALNLFQARHGVQPATKAIPFTHEGGTQWHIYRSGITLTDMLGEEVKVPLTEAYHILLAMREMATSPQYSHKMKVIFNHRRFDLDPYLTQQAISEVTQALSTKGYPSGEAMVRTIARDCTPSNHLKDLVWAALTEQVQTQAIQSLQAEPHPKQADAEASDQPPAQPPSRRPKR